MGLMCRSQFFGGINGGAECKTGCLAAKGKTIPDEGFPFRGRSDSKKPAIYKTWIADEAA
jgi:hypothetical protein